jgi:hypothetical protein
MLWKPQIPQCYVMFLSATEWQFNSGEHSVSDPCSLSALTRTLYCFYGSHIRRKAIWHRAVWCGCLHSWGLNQATGHLYSRFCVFSLETLYASSQEYPCDSRTAKTALVTQSAGTASVPHGTVQTVQENTHALKKIQQDRQWTYQQHWDSFA